MKIINHARALVVTAVIATPATAEDVKVGLVGTYTGTYGRFGRQFDQAIAVYQKIHGDSVNGNKIIIVRRDEGGPDAAKSKQFAEELVVRERVKFLTGFTWTPNTAAIAPLATETKTPSIIFNGATGSLIDASPYYIRPSYTLGQSAMALASWAYKSGIRNVVTVVPDYSAGLEVERFINATFKGAGGTVLDTIRIPLSTADFGPYYERAARLKPEAVLGFSPNSIAEVNTWAERLKPAGIKLIVTNEITETEMLSYQPGAVGAMSASHYTETNSSLLNKQLRAELSQMFGKEGIPDQFTIGAYDGIHIVYEMVRRFGPRFKPDDVIKAAAGMSFDSPRGSRLTLNEQRDAINDIDIRNVEKRDGKLVNIAIETMKAVPPLK